MSMTWDGAPPPDAGHIGAMGWLRILVRGALIVIIIGLGLALLLPLRLVEKPVFGLRRPWTPWITRVVCRVSLMAMGLRFVRRGTPMTGPGAQVANHSSWLDIFVLNASDTVYFVSKAEVAGWPGIGFLARSVGTVFIARDRREAQAQTALFETRLGARHRLLFFPEGTSTDGLRVLPFKPTLFAAFFAPNLAPEMSVQPVTVVYHTPRGHDARTYGWWGDMRFGAHLLSTLALPRQGRVEVVYHPAFRVAAFEGRKALALAAEDAVRGGHSLAQAGQT
ncbi:MAG: lysophospholipid acyltransferase family protein [Pseudomonadota bacterium]